MVNFPRTLHRHARIGRAARLVGACICAAAGACAHRQHADTRAPGIEVMRSDEATIAIGVEQLHPELFGGAGAQGSALELLVTAGKDEGARIELQYAALPGENDGVQWTRTLIAPDGVRRPVERRTLVRMPDGSAAMSEVIDYPRRAVTKFNPPLTIMPAVLAPGERFTQTVAMEVRALRRDGSAGGVRDRGEATHDIMLGDIQRVRGTDDVGKAIGPWRSAVRIRTVFASRLNTARAERITERWFTPGEGLACEHYSETVAILAVMTSTEEQSIVRIAE